MDPLTSTQTQSVQPPSTAMLTAIQTLIDALKPYDDAIMQLPESFARQQAQARLRESFGWAQDAYQIALLVLPPQPAQDSTDNQQSAQVDTVQPSQVNNDGVVQGDAVQVDSDQSAIQQPSGT